jgi:hypothetical protein
VRRVGFFAAFLLLLGLTTATAASFDVRAEDITSFSTSTSIAPPVIPPPSPNYYLNGSAPRGALLSTKPVGQSPVETGKFQPNAVLLTEDRAPGPGQIVYFMSWASIPQPNGIQFTNKKVTLEFYSPGNTFVGDISAGLFSCPVATTPVREDDCDDLVEWDNGGSALTFSSLTFSGLVAPGHELRLKVVNDGPAEWTIQWGYKDQNRFANMVVSDGTPP